MKKYLLAIATGVLILGSACDQMDQESTIPISDESLARAADNAEANLRKSFGSRPDVLAEVENNYRLMENAYPLVNSMIPKDKAVEILESSRGKEEFVRHMLTKSLAIFDQNLTKNGGSLSKLAQTRFRDKDHDEWINLVLLAQTDDSEAAVDVFIKIPDIDGEASEQMSLNFEKVKANRAAGGCDNVYCDSLPPVKAPQLIELIEFLDVVERVNGEPSQTGSALEGLKLSSGLEPVAIGLLLPAVQKVREAARVNARGKADILIEFLGKSYGLNLEDSKGKFLKFGGAGSISELMSDDYDDTGDIDWASIQLNRSKFEFEMFLLWAKYWDAYQGTDPTTGR